MCQIINDICESQTVLGVQFISRNFVGTVMILSLRTDRSGQTVLTQIRLEEQSDQGLHCLQFPLHLLDSLLYGRANCSNLRVIITNF